MNTITLTADDLKRFCWTDNGRPTIARPFSQGDWTYATNGRLLVRVPRLSDVPEYDDSPKDIQKNIFDAHLITGTWQPVPNDLPSLLEPKPCSECKGVGCLIPMRKE